MFFADKLGKLPSGVRGSPQGGEPVDPKTGQPLGAPQASQQAPRAAQPAPQQQQQRAPQPAPQAARPAPQPPAPPPEPEKKKKKGWF